MQKFSIEGSIGVSLFGWIDFNDYNRSKNFEAY